MSQFPPRFARCPQLMPRETGQSYVGRLTSFFGCRNPREFCLDFGLDLKGIHHGKPEALKGLAQITGSDLDKLIRWTPRWIDKHRMMLNGQILDTRVSPRHVVSICPECAKADIAAHPNVGWDQVVYARAEWILGVVDCCVVHGMKLVSRKAPLIDSVRLDVGYETTTLMESLGEVVAETSAPDAFQFYVLDRVLHGGVGRPAPLLDPMSLVLVSQICLAAGYDVLRRVGVTATHAERRTAGFELFGRGIEWFETRVIEMRRGLRVGQMVSSLFGRLTDYFHQERFDDPGRDRFLDAFTDVIFRSLPYPAGQVLLGRTCPRAVSCTICKVRCQPTSLAVTTCAPSLREPQSWLRTLERALKTL